MITLHHCDDPMKSLRNAFHALKPAGKIFLCSELQLHPWVRKDSWYRRLETNPVEMGHYGGNEHAYYSWEYRKMLRHAGFVNIRMTPLALSLDPLRHIRAVQSDMSGDRCPDPDQQTRQAGLTRCTGTDDVQLFTGIQGK